MPRQAQANLSALIESTEDFIWSVDLNFRLITFNSALRRHNEIHFGIRPEVGMCPEQLLPPEIAAVWPPLYRRTLAEGPFRLEHSFVDGRILELSFNPIVVDGLATGISIFGKDITDRRRAEELLQQNMEQFRLLIEHAPVALAMFDRDMRYILASRRWQTDYGLAGRDLRGLLHYEVFPGIPEHWREAHRRGLAGEVLREEAELFDLPGGSSQWIRWIIHPWHETRGAIGGIVIFTENVTERIHAEMRIRESEESMKQAERLGNLGRYELDVPTEVWTSSSVMDEIFGIGKDFDRTLTQWTALIHPDDRTKMHDYFAVEVAGKGRNFDMEYRIVRQTDLAERWVHGIGSLSLDAGGKPSKMHGVIRDITESKLSEMQLRDSEERYRSTFEQAAVGIVHTSFDGRFLRCNPRFAEIVGYPIQEIPGMTVRQVTTPGDLEESMAALEQVFSGTVANLTLEKRFVRRDGSLTWARLTISIQRDGKGRNLHFIAMVEDINARKAVEEHLASAQEALRLSESRYRTVFQTSLDFVTINRLSDGAYVDANKAFFDATGFEPDEVIGRTSLQLNIWAEPRDRQAFVKILIQNSICQNLEAKFMKKNGETFFGLISAKTIELDGVPCIISITRDITDAKESAEKIRDLAFYDPLTHLPNRRLLLERLGLTAVSRVRRRQRALLFIDIDHFKTLNDSLGHQTGDQMLLEVARRLVVSVREADTVARVSGDEFAVILEYLSNTADEAAAQAEIVGEKIRASFIQPFLLAGREFHKTCSIGIAIFGANQEQPTEVLQQAEIAMYQAKTAGRNVHRFFAPALQAAANARAALEEELRDAIKQQQFLLYYQPQVEHGRLIGVEALLRWAHPVRGILAPGEFIGLAEESGLILPLGNWVLETACKQLLAWAGRIDAAQISIAVNMSARQFNQPDFVRSVLRAIEQSGANPGKLKLELTESMLVENVEEVIAKMTELKSHGLVFSMDDFGTGYSSLAYLKRLPLDQLKIDRAFVRDIQSDVASGAIAQTIVSLGRAMGLSVIAEGIESLDQQDFLASLGCNAFQGYLFGRPLPLDEFESLWLPSANGSEPIAV